MKKMIMSVDAVSVEWPFFRIGSSFTGRVSADMLTVALYRCRLIYSFYVMYELNFL